ncbi:MAG TPA: glycosyltransferase [Chloroflexota bacterium]
MIVGIVTLDWLPRYGGSVIYTHRLARRLAALGVDVKIATATPASATGADVEFETLRPAAPMDEGDPQQVRTWYLGLPTWAKERNLSHVLINQPLSRVSHAYARELYTLLGACGCAVGAIHYDLGRDVSGKLAWNYASTSSWDDAAWQVLKEIRAHVIGQGDQGYFDIESPFYFGPDFVVSCSEWSDRFVDPLGQHAHCVLHPLLDVRRTSTDGLDLVDVSFVNPLPHKGVHTLLDLIRAPGQQWTFRVLKGGYGSGFDSFLEEVGATDAWRSRRIEMLEYTADMSEFYRRTRLLLFPSLYEGYGLAAVEPLCEGTPVVAREYPSVVEGVGDGARLVPFTALSGEWVDAIAEVLADHSVWRNRAAARAATLQGREQEELDDFIRFLESL